MIGFKWIIFNPGTNLEFAECGICGHEQEPKEGRRYPRRCPVCYGIMKELVAAKEHMKPDDIPATEGRLSLCVDCAYALPNKYWTCPWADRLEPVKGWVAEPSYRADGAFATWKVLSCPRFLHGMYRPTMDTEGVIELLSQAMRVARHDYITGNAKDRKEVTDFVQRFIGDWESAIKQLKKEAKEYDALRKDVEEEL